jgi:hypothetical protein
LNLKFLKNLRFLSPLKFEIIHLFLLNLHLPHLKNLLNLLYLKYLINLKYQLNRLHLKILLNPKFLKFYLKRLPQHLLLYHLNLRNLKSLKCR